MRVKKEVNKKAVSPMVSTVLLIMIVVVLAIIILVWTMGFIKEAITKEVAGDKKTVDKYCGEVELNVNFNNDGSFGITNNGNVPVNGFKLKLIGGGSSEIIEYGQEIGSINPGFGLNPVVDKAGNEILANNANYDEIKIIPILLGETKAGPEAYTCPERDALEVK